MPRLLVLNASPFWASLLVGALWGVWHLPTYLIPGQSSFPLPLFLLLLCGLSLIYTTLSARTDGSLLAIVALVWLSAVVLWYFAQPRRYLLVEGGDEFIR